MAHVPECPSSRKMSHQLRRSCGWKPLAHVAAGERLDNGIALALACAWVVRFTALYRRIDWQYGETAGTTLLVNCGRMNVRGPNRGNLASILGRSDLEPAVISPTMRDSSTSPSVEACACDRRGGHDCRGAMGCWAHTPYL